MEERRHALRDARDDDERKSGELGMLRAGVLKNLQHLAAAQLAKKVSALECHVPQRFPGSPTPSDCRGRELWLASRSSQCERSRSAFAKATADNLREK